MESIEDIDAAEVDYTDNPQNGVDAKKAQAVNAKFKDFNEQLMFVNVLQLFNYLLDIIQKLVV